MQHRRVRSVLMGAIAVLSSQLLGQTPPEVPADYMLIQGQKVATWREPGAGGQAESNVVQVTGPVEIKMDHTRMLADNAVIWLTPVRGTVIDQQRAEITLLGNARVEQEELDLARTGDMLQVTGTIRGGVRVTADDRVGRDMSDTDLYRRATLIRPSNVVLVPSPEPTSQPATTQPKRPFGTVEPVTFRAPGQLETISTRDGKLAVILSGGVTLLQDRKDGSLIELQSDKAVLFTNIEKLTDLQKDGEGPKSMEEAIRSCYLEGDIRIVFTPAPGARIGEQRLTGNRAYYDFTTDRAVLTDAVLHATNPKLPVPLVVRADTIRQLSRTENQAEYTAEHPVLTTSEFATPSFSVAAKKAYIRQEPSSDPQFGDVTTYTASNVTLQGFGIPYFYLPAAAGTISDDMPLRSVAFGADSRFGVFGSTTWGLFPSLGKPTPKDLDAQYTVGYWGDRGAGAGLEGKYGGAYVTDPAKDPWSFDGRFQSFFVRDQGIDDFGGSRTDVKPEDEFRGHVLWEHQHFLPGDWQVQVRAGWVSDPNFLEEWYRRDFYQDTPHDVSIYAKQQTDTEALTLLGSIQPNGFVTYSDMYQEQFEIERYPEIGYHRIGDSPFGDRFTFFSDNTASALKFNNSSASLADLGFPANVSPGLPALGTVGTSTVPTVPEDTTYRGDFREELDYKLAMGQVMAVPYVMERYTTYSTSTTGESQNRFFTGAGVRSSTSFWKVNDAAESDLFDIHRVRHVVEPGVNLFTSASTVDTGDLYIYDQDVDKINDISAAQLSLNQTWQTKRGGPGRWRSVDFMTLNVDADFFANRPPDPELQPIAFRGLFYESIPEASIPRDSLNANWTWRVSDTTILLADESYNIDENTLATTSVGLAVRRDPRVSYFFGVRYIDPLDSTIGTAAVIYQMSKKYQLALTESYNFSETGNVDSAVEVTRHFDKFWATVRVYHDSISDQSGVGFLLYPEGLGPRTSASSVGDLFSGSNRR